MLNKAKFRSFIPLILVAVLGISQIAGELNAMSMTYNNRETRQSSLSMRNVVTVVGISLVAGLAICCLVLALRPPTPPNTALIPVITKKDQAPIIEHFEWGTIIVRYGDGSRETYSDKNRPNGGNCIIWPTGSRFWDWTIHNTHHNPGIQIGDVQELINQADQIILSRGIDLVLQVPQGTVDYLERAGKRVHVLQSQEAARLYNQLVEQGLRVAIVLHSTC